MVLRAVTDASLPRAAATTDSRAGRSPARARSRTSGCGDVGLEACARVDLARLVARSPRRCSSGWSSPRSPAMPQQVAATGTHDVVGKGQRERLELGPASPSWRAEQVGWTAAEAARRRTQLRQQPLVRPRHRVEHADPGKPLAALVVERRGPRSRSRGRRSSRRSRPAARRRRSSARARRRGARAMCACPSRDSPSSSTAWRSSGRPRRGGIQTGMPGARGDLDERLGERAPGPSRRACRRSG